MFPRLGAEREGERERRERVNESPGQRPSTLHTKCHRGIQRTYFCFFSAAMVAWSGIVATKSGQCPTQCLESVVLHPSSFYVFVHYKFSLWSVSLTLKKITYIKIHSCRVHPKGEREKHHHPIGGGESTAQTEEERKQHHPKRERWKAAPHQKARLHHPRVRKNGNNTCKEE